MAVPKYKIYEYWRDKAITRAFQVKRLCDCTPEDDEVQVTGAPDEIFCWACQIPPYAQGEHRKLSALWNSDGLLQRAHILASSKGGENLPSNMFLLCPQCHAESPDTTNPRNFFAWVYYKRTHENFAMTMQKDFIKAAEILNVDMRELETQLPTVQTAEELSYLREEMAHRCAMHGTFLAPMTKMMAMVDWMTDEESQREFARWRKNRAAVPREREEEETYIK